MVFTSDAYYGINRPQFRGDSIYDQADQQPADLSRATAHNKHLAQLVQLAHLARLAQMKHLAQLKQGVNTMHF